MKPSKGNHRRHRPAPARHKLCSAVLLAMFACTAPAWAQRNDAPQAYSITAGDLASALDQLASQSKVQIIYPAELVRGKRAAAVNGQQTWRDVLQALLAGTGLTYGFVNDTTVVIRRSEPARAPSRPQRQISTTSEDSTPVTNMAEILVKGSRSLNADIRRTINDPQPYVVFERQDIERSGAINLNDFIISRVSASTSNTTPSQSGTAIGDVSRINLRGLGEGQTLILIDGRRAAQTYVGSAPGQVNLNGIPLASVERIEVLPTTASAIYGGSATGGVINVILRRDYQGGEVSVSHDDSFDTDSAINRLDISYGFSIGDKTRVSLSGSYSEANLLLKRDRNFRARGIDHINDNNPGFLSIPILLSTSPNIVSTSGTDLILLDGTPLHSSVTYAPTGYLGPGADGGSALVTNAGQINSEDDRNAYFSSGGSSFGAAPQNTSLSASLRHQFTEWLDGFLDMSSSKDHSKQPAAVPVLFNLPVGHEFNPFRQAIRVAVPYDEFNNTRRHQNESERASVGLIARLGNEWAGSLDFTWSKSTNSYTNAAVLIDYAAAMSDGFNPIIDYYNLGGRSLRHYVLGEGGQFGPSSAYSYNPTLRFSGPMFSLPAGAVAASFLIEQQRVKLPQFTNNLYTGFPQETITLNPARAQDVVSAYTELSVPIFGGSNPRSLIHSLDLQLSARYDDYKSVTGDTVTWRPRQGGVQPTSTTTRGAVSKASGLLGVKYTPFPGMTFRAAHGTGFVPPDVTQVRAPLIVESGRLTTPDPHRGNTVNSTPVVRITGGNPELGPELSRTTSFGIIIEPEAFSGYRASFDYIRLQKTDNISVLSEALLLQYEESFPDRVVRGTNLPSDEPGWAGPITYFDTSLVNAATAKYEALDAQLKYGFTLPRGAFIDLWANGTWTLTAEQQAIANGPTDSLRGITAQSGADAPLNFRGFYGVNIEANSWAAGWTTRHYSSYLVADPKLGSSARILAAQGGGGRVPKQMVHDVWGRWQPAHMPQERGGYRTFLSSFEISGGIRNVFNTSPEVDVSNNNTFYSYLVDPRLRTYYVQIKYVF